MDVLQNAQVLLRYLESLESFEFLDYCDGNYNHMGATIADAILQAGLNYDSVVRPRIQKIKANYPDANTTSTFLKLLHEVSAKTVLDWNDDEKPNRVMELANFFLDHKIETEQDLLKWLTVETNRSSLLKVRGIGPKTADYLKILVGFQTAAPDRHLFSILGEAGISVDYDNASKIINLTADILKMDRTCLDHSIWKFMSQRNKDRDASGRICQNS